MATAANLILRYVLEGLDDDDIKDVTLPPEDPFVLARRVWASANNPEEGIHHNWIPLTPTLNAVVRCKQGGRRISVEIRADANEPLKQKVNQRTTMFSWPADEKFFVNTLARRIGAVLADEPRRNLIAQLYAAVSSLKHTPEWEAWVEAVGEYKDNHPSDYSKMTEEDVLFWFEQIKRFQ